MSPQSNHISIHPANCKEWLNVMNERGKDANALFAQQRDVAVIYMAGYMIEASLKAYYASKGQSYPTSGREGHNLSALWSKAQISFPPSCDAVQIFEFFLQCWSTDLRYSVDFSFPSGSKNMLDGAKRLVGIISSTMKRSRLRC